MPDVVGQWYRDKCAAKRFFRKLLFRECWKIDRFFATAGSVESDFEMEFYETDRLSFLYVNAPSLVAG